MITINELKAKTFSNVSVAHDMGQAMVAGVSSRDYRVVSIWSKPVVELYANGQFVGWIAQ